MPRHRSLLGVAVLSLLVVGCASTRVTLTARSGVEQQLLVRSLERAVARLEISRMAGKRVALDLFALTGDQAFAKQFVTARLEERGVEVVADQGKAELKLKIFASVLGVDRSQTLLGFPEFVTPGVLIPIPEIALFKWVRNRGHSEVQIFAYDAGSEKYIDVTPAGVGRAKFDEFTILFVISFSRSDLDEPPTPSGR